MAFLAKSASTLFETGFSSSSIPRIRNWPIGLELVLVLNYVFDRKIFGNSFTISAEIINKISAV